jgi:hypothetical protein
LVCAWLERAAIGASFSVAASEHGPIMQLSFVRATASLSHTHKQVGMKIERIFFNFSAEKQKRNKNTETQMEFCKTKAETEYFW